MQEAKIQLLQIKKQRDQMRANSLKGATISSSDVSSTLPENEIDDVDDEE